MCKGWKNECPSRPFVRYRPKRRRDLDRPCTMWTSQKMEQAIDLIFELEEEKENKKNNFICN
jgi:hypothetical protein